MDILGFRSKILFTNMDILDLRVKILGLAQPFKCFSRRNSPGGEDYSGIGIQQQYDDLRVSQDHRVTRLLNRLKKNVKS